MSMTELTKVSCENLVFTFMFMIRICGFWVEYIPCGTEVELYSTNQVSVEIRVQFEKTS